MQKNRKSDSVYQTLRQEIIDLPPGTPIPSVRELMRRLEVSQITVTRALKLLKEEGLVEAQVGQGSFRSGLCNGVVRRRLVMLTGNYMSSFEMEMRRVFQQYFEWNGYIFELMVYDHRHIRLEPEAIRGTAADAVIFNLNQDFTPELITQVAGLKLPLVFIDIMPQTLPLDAVCTDNELAGAMVANCFLQNGHRKCAMLQAMPEFHSVISRRRSFLRQLQLAGYAGKLIDCHTRSGENSTENAYRAFCEYVRENGCDFTALFCDNDLGALGVLKACHDLGIEVPKDLSVIGFDNLVECGYFQPSLSSVDQNVAEWAAETEKILKARFLNDGRRSIQSCVAPKLILRDSMSSI